MIPASMAGFLLFTYPIIVCLMAYLTGEESMDSNKLMALAVSLTGSTLVLGPVVEQVEWYGVSLVMLAAFLYSMYVVGSGRILKKVHWFPASAVLTVSCAGFFLIRDLFMNNGRTLLEVNSTALYYGTVLGVFSTFLAIGCFYLGLSIIGPSKASIISTLEPVVTACLSALVFSEQMTVLQIFGASFILFAILILQKAREAKPAGKRTSFLKKIIKKNGSYRKDRPQTR